MLAWGAFIDVGNGHRGLLHVDEMRWPEGVLTAPTAFECVKENQVLEVRLPACVLVSAAFVRISSGACRLKQSALCSICLLLETTCSISKSLFC